MIDRELLVSVKAMTGKMGRQIRRKVIPALVLKPGGWYGLQVAAQDNK
jgi:hypothetical protein